MGREVRAADLPAWSIVATQDRVYIKDCGTPRYPWDATGGAGVGLADEDLNDLLLREGAEVLRVGTGEEN